MGKAVVMQLLRHITVVDANLGRGATIPEFKDNVQRLATRVPGKNIFYGLQEVDEDDKPEEFDYIKDVFGNTHTIVGGNTHVPILVPKSFSVAKRDVEKKSDGVKKLQPDRYISRALVYPRGHPKRKVNAINTHFGRDIAALKSSRDEMRVALSKEIRLSQAGWLTADLNEHNAPAFANPEKRAVTAGIDYIRLYESEKVSFRILNRGTIRLTGDGHNGHWVQLHAIWH